MLWEMSFHSDRPSSMQELGLLPLLVLYDNLPPDQSAHPASQPSSTIVGRVAESA